MWSNPFHFTNVKTEAQRGDAMCLHGVMDCEVNSPPPLGMDWLSQRGHFCWPLGTLEGWLTWQPCWFAPVQTFWQLTRGQNVGLTASHGREGRCLVGAKDVAFVHSHSARRGVTRHPTRDRQQGTPTQLTLLQNRAQLAAMPRKQEHWKSHKRQL